jgi:hypothetical protein
VVVAYDRIFSSVYPSIKEYILCPTTKSKTKSKKGKGNGSFLVEHLIYDSPHIFVTSHFSLVLSPKETTIV